MSDREKDGNDGLHTLGSFFFFFNISCVIVIETVSIVAFVCHNRPYIMRDLHCLR